MEVVQGGLLLADRMVVENQEKVEEMGDSQAKSLAESLR